MDIFSLIEKEKHRQLTTLEMIPSENYVSPDVMKALGSELNNKYSEGYPRKRYYGGNQFIDEIEELAIERAKHLFGAEHVNVQSYSGSPANMAVFFALLEPGDKFMGLSLPQGGHLTHGSAVSFSGKFFKPVHYGVDKETEMLDYDAIRKQAMEEKPKMIISGFTAYPRTIDFSEFKSIAEEVGAYSFADISHIAGLVAGGAHPSPFPFTDVVTTTTHKTLRGPRGAMIMCRESLAQRIDKAVFPLLQGGPHDNAVAAKAVAFDEASRPEFAEYAKRIVSNAKTLAVALMGNGFRLVSGGTDNHLILIDMTNTGLSGKQGEEILDMAGITVNRNTIPYDTRKPMDPSGIRLGTPILTTRGMRESEMKEIAGFMSDALIKRKDPKIIRSNVEELCKEFPAFAW